MIVGVSAALLLVGMLTLVPLGLRAGDRPGDARLLAVTPNDPPPGAFVTLANPGETPVMVGLTLRPAGLRLRLEGAAYVRIRTRSTARGLLARRQAAIAVLDAGETATVLVRAPAPLRERQLELVAVFGQRDRLRIVHRRVQTATSLPGAPPRRRPPRPRRDRPTPVRVAWPGRAVR